MCAKSFRGACAYDKFPGRFDVAMCGGLEIGEALLGHFLCGSKGAFFFGFAVLFFIFFFGGVVSGIFRLKNVFYFVKKFSLSLWRWGYFLLGGLQGARFAAFRAESASEFRYVYCFFSVCGQWRGGVAMIVKIEFFS